MTIKGHVDTHCEAFQLAVAMLSRPWTAVILNVLQAGPLRFTEIAQRCRGVGDKVLSARLKELEAAGVLVRDVTPGPPVRVSYVLTEAGLRFKDVAGAIEKWGQALSAAEAAGMPAPRREKRTA